VINFDETKLTVTRAVASIEKCFAETRPSFVSPFMTREKRAAYFVEFLEFLTKSQQAGELKNSVFLQEVDVTCSEIRGLYNRANNDVKSVTSIYFEALNLVKSSNLFEKTNDRLFQIENSSKQFLRGF